MDTLSQEITRTASLKRLQNNRAILKILSDFIEHNPDTRFIQALWNLGIIDSKPVKNNLDYYSEEIVDRFYEESIETLKRIGNKG